MWNRISEPVGERIVELALEVELAVTFTSTEGYFILSRKPQSIGSLRRTICHQPGFHRDQGRRRVQGQDDGT
ncbi:hypothetical protein AJ88_37355 [Mesorhizobium amorphae CCBAU 01583]|nr:hypothetical protein AJ88_37355 [Mesorhizobium amorphae CCBAU 01583]